MAKRGPREKILRDDIRRKVLDGIRAGATYELACKYAGIGRSTFYSWMAAGRDGEEPYAAFLDEVYEAEGAGSLQLLATIKRAAMNGQWQAAAWVLERRYPAMYGRAETRRSDQGDEPPQAAADLTTPEGQEAALKALASVPRGLIRKAMGGEE